MITYEEFAPSCHILHPIRGAIPFSPYDYQKEIVRHIEENKFTVTLGSRQMGTTTTMGSWCLWKAANEPGTKIGIIYNRHIDGIEFLDRVRFMVEAMTAPSLPYIVSMTKNQIVFANGSKIELRSSRPFLPSEQQDYTHLMIINAAWVHDGGMGDLWTSIQPMLNNGVKLIMESCAGYTNTMFHKIVDRSPLNGISVLRLPWSIHPDRDESWASSFLSMIGAKSFRQQYEVEFIDKD